MTTLLGPVDRSEGGKVGFSKAVLAYAVALVAVISLFAVPVTALDRSEGDFWVYEGGMEYDSVSISGGYRFEFEAKDSLTVGTESYDVNVLKVTGSMTGETDESALVQFSIAMVFDGYVYDVEGTMASVKEDTYTWTNVTTGAGALPTVTMIELHDVSTYSPPIPTGFVDGETGTGDEWEETTDISSTTATWIDGLVDESLTYNYTETYSCSVAAAEETVTTEAGTFSCLKMTVTDSLGDYEIYWYSSDVGNWVKISSYSVMDPVPYLTLELTDYQYSGDSLTVMLVLAGVGILVVVVVVVAFLLVRKKGRTPAQAPQQMPPPPPPTG